MSRDNVVCNRSILKYFKAEAMFTELQALRSSGGTIPVNATPIPTMSLAEVTRAADLLSNCTHVGPMPLWSSLSRHSDHLNSHFCGRGLGPGGRSSRSTLRRCRSEILSQATRERSQCCALNVFAQEGERMTLMERMVMQRDCACFALITVVSPVASRPYFKLVRSETDAACMQPGSSGL